jgi:MoaA/NifB/PqqE/SkfB family radical SAM enzyme
MPELKDKKKYFRIKTNNFHNLIEKIRNLSFIPEICITNKCNQNCLFCSADANSPNCYIKEDKLENIKNTLRDLRRVSDRIKITGGEPTVRKDFLEIIKHAKKLGFKKIIIESNGQNFSVFSFAQKTVEAGANYFFISFHGPNAKLQDSLTQSVSSFLRTKQGIINLKKLNQEVNINVVINAKNYKSLPKMIVLLNKLKVNSITLSFIIVSGKAEQNKKIIPKMTEVLPYLKKAVSAAVVRIRITHFPFCLLGELNKYNTWIKIQGKTIIDNPNFIITIEPKDMHDRKSESCKKCRYDKICFGLREGYVALYGFDELKPVAGPKIKDFETYYAQNIL